MAALLLARAHATRARRADLVARGGRERLAREEAVAAIDFAATKANAAAEAMNDETDDDINGETEESR